MSDPELKALLYLLGQLFFDARTGILMLLLVVAAVYDCRSHRIPNALVASGAVYGLAYNLALPPDLYYPILFPVAGLLLGFLLFLPLYLIRVLGAGDVKLFAMVGAFIGPIAASYAAIATFVAGGVLSIAFVLRRGNAVRLYQNVSMSLRLAMLGAASGTAPQLPRFTPANSAGKLPYAVAIAIGTIGYLVLHQLGIA
jgi:prepilin peptidase CpaA